MPQHSNHNRLSRSQYAFLRRCQLPGETLADALSAGSVSPRTLATWMEHKTFRAAVSRLRRTLAWTRELELELGATRAASLLSRAALKPRADDDGASADVLKRRGALVDLVKLARDVTSARRANVRARPAALPLVHPDVPAQEAAALRAALE